MMLLLSFETPEDTNKFITLYNRYWKTVYYTLKRFSLDEATIEDLSQEIFIIVSNNMHKIDLDEYKRTQNYIITITRNYCINYLNRHSQEYTSNDEEITLISSHTDTPLDYIIYKENFSELIEEIHCLDFIYKSVLELKYVNNLNNTEIASILNISKKTVEMRLYRA